MQRREERPSSAPPRGGETDQFLDQASALLAVQVPTIMRLDAIIQILFSAGLIADVLPRLWARDPEEWRIRQAELTLLSHIALAEVRKLLLDLRLAEWVEGHPAGVSDDTEP
jgi:hypothetical protein